MKNGILLVDDEPQVLSAYKRALRKDFKVDTATGGEQALEKAAETPYAVVVSDLKMPGMNGITFLKEVKERYPDTVTMMLTGKVDVRLAIAAVNQGAIFRFLTKPCDASVLAAGLTAAVAQHELIQAEKNLLEETVKGAIQSMTRILSITCPDSFSRASRMERLVTSIAAEAKLQDAWEFEVAASLSQLGCVTLPASILRKLAAGEVLTDCEQRTYDEHPKQGALLIGDIPRLDRVQAMIETQAEPFSKRLGFELGGQLDDEERVSCGAQLLKLTHDYDLELGRQPSPPKAIARLRKQDHLYHPDFLQMLSKFVDQGEREFKRISTTALREGMTLEQDVFGRSDRLLVKRGQLVCPIIIRFIERVEMMGGLVTGKVLVSIPIEPDETET